MLICSGTAEFSLAWISLLKSKYIVIQEARGLLSDTLQNKIGVYHFQKSQCKIEEEK